MFVDDVMPEPALQGTATVGEARRDLGSESVQWSPAIPRRTAISRLEDVLGLALRLGGAACGGVTVVSADGDVLELLAAGTARCSGGSLRTSPSLAGLTRLVVQRHKAVRCDDPQ